MVFLHAGVTFDQRAVETDRTFLLSCRAAIERLDLEALALPKLVEPLERLLEVAVRFLGITDDAAGTAIGRREAGVRARDRD